MENIIKKDNVVTTNDTNEKVPILVKPKFSIRKISRKKILIISTVIVVLLLLLTVLFALPVYRLYEDAKAFVPSAQNFKKSLSNQDLIQSEQDLDVIQSQLITIEKDYRTLVYLRYIPFVRKFYIDGEAILSAGNHSIIAGEILLNGIEPYADIFGFKTSTSTEISADKKLEELAVNMPQLLPPFDAAMEEFGQIESLLQEINPNDYPRKLGKYELRDTIAIYLSYLEEGKKVAGDIRPMLEVLPKAMGEPNPVNYLILFQNDKELRPTGGFITAYALVTMDKGRFKIIKSEDIYNIDKDQSYVDAPSYIQNYLVPRLYMRDTNIYPDFKVSMDLFQQYWDKLGIAQIEGIIALDTEFVRSFMEVLGPINMPKYGETFEASNIVYELELYSEKVLKGPYRKDLLGDIMGEMVKRVMNAKKDQWRPLIDKAITEITQKHMLFYFHNQTLQQFAESYNFAGRIMDFDGDYLHVSDANLGGLKSDYWVERQVNQRITITDDGTVTKEVSITFSNKGAYDGWLNAITRNYTRIYVPLGSKLLRSSGGTFGEHAEVYEELGKTVFANFSRTWPLQSETITFVYELPFKISKTGLFGKQEYKLMVQKQPGLGNPQPELHVPIYTIEINGQLMENYDLFTDKSFNWTLN